MAYESPRYRVIDHLAEEVEIRNYDPYVVAEVSVEGPAGSAGNDGFRVLAGYIFGANRGSGQGADDKTKIAMTSPVTQQASDGRYVVRFMMPSEYSVETLPEPEDRRIRLREVEGWELAAVRYGGRWSSDRYQDNLERLLDGLNGSDLRPTGDPIWARYDPCGCPICGRVR